MKIHRFVHKNLLFILLVAIAVTTWSCSGGGRGSRERSPEIVDGGAIFHFEDRDASTVYLTGDFNNWSPKADPMSDTNDDGEWTLFYSLAPGLYEYKFVVNGLRWVPDPRNPDSVPDGFNGENSVVRIPK